MLNRYDDILKRIVEPPLWFDEHGVPRWCDFAPDRTANVHAQECALILIECQGCARPFRVAVSEANLRHILFEGEKRRSYISVLIAQGVLHYGDPPDVGCCAAGAAMNSLPKRVLEYWYKPIVRDVGVRIDPRTGHRRITAAGAMDWTRDPDFEIAISPAGRNNTASGSFQTITRTVQRPGEKE